MRYQQRERKHWTCSECEAYNRWTRNTCHLCEYMQDTVTEHTESVNSKHVCGDKLALWHLGRTMWEHKLQTPRTLVKDTCTAPKQVWIERKPQRFETATKPMATTQRNWERRGKKKSYHSYWQRKKESYSLTVISWNLVALSEHRNEPWSEQPSMAKHWGDISVKEGL